MSRNGDGKVSLRFVFNLFHQEWLKSNMYDQRYAMINQPSSSINLLPQSATKQWNALTDFATLMFPPFANAVKITPWPAKDRTVRKYGLLVGARSWLDRSRFFQVKTHSL